ncbi:hypothetical protein AAHK20_33425, partial [Trinickia sp. YCB016]
MHKSEPQPQPAARRLTALSLAVTAALAAMTPHAAKSQTVISGNVNSTQWWTSGNFTVNKGALISTSATAVAAIGSSLGTLTNNGTLNGVNTVQTSGNIAALINNGTITATIVSAGTDAFENSGTIGSLVNSGTISGWSVGLINNPGTIGTLTNSGTISGRNTAIDNVSPSGIGTLSNSGTIRATGIGLYNGGTIGSLVNSGTITGNSYAIYNDTTGTIGPITNSGVIAGNIVN